MVEIDIVPIWNLVLEFFTFFLITLPQNFISSTLVCGVFRTIWVGVFGNAQVIQASFIFALIGGAWLIARNGVSLRGTSGGKRRTG